MVRQGDYLSKLAFTMGVDADATWNHSGNDELRAKRPNPEMLHPGDILSLPEPVAAPIRVSPGASLELVHLSSTGAGRGVTLPLGPFSLAGPWVGVAAPGTDLTSLDSRPGRGGLVVGLNGTDSTVPISGTSFATAYVSATVALVRARYPHLDARAVMRRITATATGSGDGPDPRTGHGVIDPLAALTAQIPDVGDARAQRFSPPPAARGTNPVPMIVALSGAALLVVVLAVTSGVTRPRIEPLDDDL